MYKYLKICIIGNGIHSKRIQKILSKKKLNFFIYKPKSKKNFKKENLSLLKKYNVFFIISPNHTHFHYIKSLYEYGYIFCEKPPANNAIELNKLNKINSKKIYYNFNFRFSKIAKILRQADKYNLGNLVHANILSCKSIAFKKDYKFNPRSSMKTCPKGVLEMVAIHWIDLFYYLFNVTKVNKPSLLNLSKFGNSYDNCNVTLEINKKFLAYIFCSYTSPLINKKTFIYENGIVEQDENFIKIKGPALNYDSRKFLKPPNIIKKFNISDKIDYSESLTKSVDYFFAKVVNKKTFSKRNNLMVLNINKLII